MKPRVGIRPFWKPRSRHHGAGFGRCNLSLDRLEMTTSPVGEVELLDDHVLVVRVDVRVVLPMHNMQWWTDGRQNGLNLVNSTVEGP